MSTVIWWVDSSYNSHRDCKGHTGYMMSLGKKEVASYPMKKIKCVKVNKKRISRGRHRWELPGNYRDFIVVMVFYLFF